MLKYSDNFSKLLEAFFDTSRGFFGLRNRRLISSILELALKRFGISSLRDLFVESCSVACGRFQRVCMIVGSS